MTSDIPTTLRVVRRDPEVFIRHEDFDYNELTDTRYNVVDWVNEDASNEFEDERFHELYVDADLAADLAWNRTIETLIAEAEGNLERSDPTDHMYRDHLQWLIPRLIGSIRPIPSGGEDV